MATVACQQCHKPIEVPPSRVNRTRFCSRTCYAKWLSENRSGTKHHMYGKKHSAESLAKMTEQKRATAKRGPETTNWKGGRHTSRGYVMIAVSTLPKEEQALFSSMANRSSQRAIPEHRLVMARSLGRPLTRSEIVHHKNGIKNDNRLANLEIKGNDDHKKEHWQVLQELRRLRGENERLYLLLSMFLNATSPTNGTSTSSQPE